MSKPADTNIKTRPTFVGVIEQWDIACWQSTKGALPDSETISCTVLDGKVLDVSVLDVALPNYAVHDFAVLGRHC